MTEAERRDQIRAVRRAWRRKNRERLNAASREDYRKDPRKKAAATCAWRQRNRDRVLEKRRAWRRINLTSHNESRRAHYLANREKLMAQKKEWDRQNLEPRREGQYRSRIKGLPPQVQEMRRALRDFTGWCRANGYTGRRQFLADTLPP